MRIVGSTVFGYLKTPPVAVDLGTSVLLYNVLTAFTASSGELITPSCVSRSLTNFFFLVYLDQRDLLLLQ